MGTRLFWNWYLVGFWGICFGGVCLFVLSSPLTASKYESKKKHFGTNVCPHREFYSLQPFKFISFCIFLGSEKKKIEISFLTFSFCPMAKILPWWILTALYQMSILAIKHADESFFDEVNKSAEESSHSACLELFIKIRTIFHWQCKKNFWIFSYIRKFLAMDTISY